MKMEAVRKAEVLVESEVPSTNFEEGKSLVESAQRRETAVKENHIVADSNVLSSMPCLLMELRRDSSESHLASTENDKPAASRAYESDSSNHCILSPSSSGHLADSDTLSSAEEHETSQAVAGTGDASGATGSAVGRKSRRSRSESETPTMAAKKNRQSSDKQNGRVSKVKGHKSQKHKERIRLLRQKREAASRKKYNLLQDSSTSDSDLTCDSSTSSSDDDEVSGSSKTITAEIPGPVGVGLIVGDKSTCGPVPINEELLLPSSDSEVEIVGVQENARFAHPRGGVIQTVSSWKNGSSSQYISAQSVPWTTMSPTQHWSSPPEVVDLTLDEDARRKYLL